MNDRSAIATSRRKRSHQHDDIRIAALLNKSRHELLLKKNIFPRSSKFSPLGILPWPGDFVASPITLYSQALRVTLPNLT